MEFMALLAGLWPGWLLGPLAGGAKFFRPKDGRYATSITFAPPPGMSAGQIVQMLGTFEVKFALGSCDGVHKWEDGRKTFIFTVWTSSKQRTWIIGLMRGYGCNVFAEAGPEIKIRRPWRGRH